MGRCLPVAGSLALPARELALLSDSSRQVVLAVRAGGVGTFTFYP